jgi:hypothetical protein
VGATSNGPLIEARRVGSVAGLDETVGEAEQAAFTTLRGEASSGKTSVLSDRPRSATSSAANPVHGLITVARPDRAFTEDDREVLRSLGVEAALALENIELELHNQVQRQAATDELTGWPTTDASRNC